MSKIKFVLKTDAGTMTLCVPPDFMVSTHKKKGIVVSSTYRADSIKVGDEICCVGGNEVPKEVLLIESTGQE